MCSGKHEVNVDVLMINHKALYLNSKLTDEISMKDP